MSSHEAERAFGVLPKIGYDQKFFTREAKEAMASFATESNVFADET